jgi:PAS domain-containing protein
MAAVRALKREVKRLEYDLKASVGHLPLLRSMVEGSRDGLALLSDEGHLIEHNSAFAIMLGTSEGLLGAPLDALLSRHDSTEPLWPPSNDDLPLIVNPRRGEFLELVIARIDTDKHLLMIEGGIPGAKNGLVTVRHAVKTKLGKGGQPR